MIEATLNEGVRLSRSLEIEALHVGAVSTIADWGILATTPYNYDAIWLPHPFQNLARGPSFQP